MKRKRSKVSRRSKKSKSRRRSGQRSVLRKLEVKYMNKNIQQTIYERSGTTTSLSSSDYTILFAYPAQGTSDIDRIGDTINPVKIWVRMTVESITGRPSVNLRVIIFTLPVAQTTLQTVTFFWQSSASNQAINGNVNREVVHKVYYDKTFNINTGTSYYQSSSNTNNPTACCAKPRSINIRLRKPIVFGGGVIIPKEPKNTFYIAYLGYAPGGALLDASVGFINCSCNFYFTD